MSGKGDKRRPTDEAAYSDGWERIFGNGLQLCKEVQGCKADGGARSGQGREAGIRGQDHAGDPSEVSR